MFWDNQYRLQCKPVYISGGEQVKVEITDSTNKVNDMYVYELIFSDNPYIMRYSTPNYMDMLEKQAIMDGRIELFFSKKTNELKTSDMGFEYILKSDN